MPLLIDHFKERAEELATKRRVPLDSPDDELIADLRRRRDAWRRVARYYSRPARALGIISLVCASLALAFGLITVAIPDPEALGVAVFAALAAFTAGGVALGFRGDSRRANDNADSFSAALAEFVVEAPPGALSTPAAAPEDGALTMTNGDDT